MTYSKNKRRFIILFIIIFLFSNTIGTLTPRSAKAQNTVIGDIVQTAKNVADVIAKIKSKVWKKMLASAWQRTYQMFLETIAYHAAIYLTEGGPGKSKAWNLQNWKSYLKDAGEASTAEFLDSAITSLSYQIATGTPGADNGIGYGLDICSPPSGINLGLKVGIDIGKKGKVAPRCSLSDIKKKWGALGDKLWGPGGKKDPLALMKLNGSSLSKLGLSAFNIKNGAGNFDVANQVRANILKSTILTKETDLGYVQYMLNEVALKAEKVKKERIRERINPDSPKPKVTMITGDVTVPGMVAEKDLEKMQKTNDEAAKKDFGDTMIDVQNIFLSTLANKAMRALMEKMFEYKPQNEDYDGDGATGDINLFVFSRESSIIDKTFTSLKKLSYSLNPKNIDIISEMEADLGSDSPGKMNNKTIDADFAEVLRRAQGGQVLTLREAIDEGLIDSSKWFGYLDVASKDPKQPSVAEGFSAQSIKKLVKNRVVPVGWQFAAEIIKSRKGQGLGCNAQGCTLKDVLEQYDHSGTYIITNNGDEEKYKNEYCGWRPISAEPYYISDITNANNCTSDYLSNHYNLTGVNVKWVGSANNISGSCYKYEDTSNPLDGIIDSISIDNSISSEEACRSKEPTESSYYEWSAGGCMIIEEDESPLCHLVNPDTILKASPQQCTAEGYYSALQNKEVATRQKDCADTKQCLREDAQGKCIGGYGYCLKEENVWNFSGDTCSKQYNSCMTLVDDQGQKQSYLVDTLKDCPQTEVGCRDYIVEKKSVDGQYIWDNDAQRIYFNNSAEKCSDQDSGCSEFIEVKPGINLIPNGSFEINDGIESQKVAGWSLANNISLEEGDSSNLGNYIVKHTGATSDYLYMDYMENKDNKRIFFTPNKGLYTLSYYARGDATTKIIPKLEFYFYDGNSSIIENTDAVFSGSNSWQRVSGYFSVPQNKKVKYVDLRFQMKGDVYIDGVQFELNKLVDSDLNSGLGNPSTYKEYGQSSKSYFKKAPDYLNCEDYDLNAYNCKEDYNPCCDYVKYCPAEDLSCSAYYPENGDPFVPAVLNEDDFCVAECNNYQTYVALPSYFDNLESIENTGSEAEVMDKNFIAQTAKDCSEPSCELFTNIDKLENGAESKEYYSFVRQCVKPSDQGVNVKLYYTWEGSDTSAFQLKTWKLLTSNETDTYNLDTDNQIQGGYAPCTNVKIGQSECVDNASTNVQECNPDNNLDCRTFYDENALPHNRLLSKTIPITAECINLRRELSDQIYKVAPSMSKSCQSSNLGCTTYKGNNSDNLRNIFKADFENGSTLGWMADALQPDGSVSNSINLIHSSEAIQYNGSSMKVWVGDNSQEIWLSYNLTQAGKIILANKQYSLSFWAKAFGDNNSGINPAPSSNQFEHQDLSFSPLFYKKARAEGADDSFLTFDADFSVQSDEWLLYKYDIVDFTTNQDGDVILTFKININNSVYTYDGFYIDNIILKGMTNSFNKIANSWETPRVCIENNYLGCQAYKDTDGNLSYLYKFSDLCPEENIGCTAMIDTQNSTMPWQQTFNAYCGAGSSDTECALGKYYYKNYFDVDPNTNTVSSTIVIPEDKLVYLVQDDTYSCSAINKGCQKMSVIDNDGSNQDINLKNNPDYYIAQDLYGGQNSILCLDKYKNCVSFKTKQGSRLHKIHPRNLTCEYHKEDTENNIPAGFYTKDNKNCAGLLYNKNYDDFTANIAENWKPYNNYDNKYAALCPTEQDSCTGFIDPQDDSSLSDYVYSHLAIVLNYNDPSQWKQALWSKDGMGTISDFNANSEDSGVSYHSAVTEGDYDGLNVNLTNGANGTNVRNLLIYRGPNYDDNIFNFNVQSGSTYRLSAKVKFSTAGTSADSVMTFLSCKPDFDSSNTSFNNYLLDNENSNKIPYAFPAINSNYLVNNKNDDKWQYIYGLYNILPGAQYCNLAFYINGVANSKFTIADIKLEKVDGDYYYLNNDKLDYKSCQAPDLKKGCVLFQNINNSELKWNYKNSYTEHKLSPELSALEPNNVDTLLKVNRNRQCAEWLSCGAHLKSIDPATGQTKDSCVSLIACDELSADKAGVCAHPFLHGQKAQPLTLDYYQQMRGKSRWSDLDYSGYSIPGLYPLDALTPVEINSDTGTTTILGHLVIRQNSANQPFVYKLGVGVANYLQSFSNQNNTLIDSEDFNNLVKKSCRLYPEKDSPFPWIAGTNIVTEGLLKAIDNDDIGNSAAYVDIKSKTANFANANICQTGSGSPLLDVDGNPLDPKGNDCECNYIKANYGSKNLYFPYNFSDDLIPDKIGIDYGGEELSLEKKRSQTKYLGWRGFCLDKDKSLFINGTESLGRNGQDYRCLTWYPVDLLTGEMNAYAIHEEADISNFVNISGDEKLCVLSEDYKLPTDYWYCVEEEEDNGNNYCKEAARVKAGSYITVAGVRNNPHLLDGGFYECNSGCDKVSNLTSKPNIINEQEDISSNYNTHNTALTLYTDSSLNMKKSLKKNAENNTIEINGTTTEITGEFRYFVNKSGNSLAEIPKFTSSNAGLGYISIFQKEDLLNSFIGDIEFYKFAKGQTSFSGGDNESVILETNIPNDPEHPENGNQFNDFSWIRKLDKKCKTYGSAPLDCGDSNGKYFSVFTKGHPCSLDFEAFFGASLTFQVLMAASAIIPIIGPAVAVIGGVIAGAIIWAKCLCRWVHKFRMRAQKCAPGIPNSYILFGNQSTEYLKLNIQAPCDDINNFNPTATNGSSSCSNSNSNALNLGWTESENCSDCPTVSAPFIAHGQIATTTEDVPNLHNDLVNQKLRSAQSIDSTDINNPKLWLGGKIIDNQGDQEQAPNGENWIINFSNYKCNNEIYSDINSDSDVYDTSNECQNDEWTSDTSDENWNQSVASVQQYASGGRRDPARAGENDNLVSGIKWKAIGLADNSENCNNDYWQICFLKRCIDVKCNSMNDYQCIYDSCYDFYKTDPGGEYPSDINKYKDFISNLDDYNGSYYDTQNENGDNLVLAPQISNYFGTFEFDINPGSLILGNCIDNCGSCSGKSFAECCVPSVAESTCSAQGGCVQSCQAYASLEDVIYNSKNVYLNHLELDKLSSNHQPNSICNVNGDYICPVALSGEISTYNAEAVMRFNKVASSTGEEYNGEYSSVNEPFSSALEDADDDGQSLKSWIFIKDSDRSGSNKFFYDYYANSAEGETISNAQTRLDEVLVKVPDQNFKYLDDSTSNWTSVSNANLSGWPVANFWNLAKHSENFKPVIKTVDYSEEGLFFDGEAGISINNTHGENILAEDGNLYAYLMFYAYAQNGATPIQKIIIDWTGLNADRLVLQGPFKNHKHDCVRKCGADYKAISDWNNSEGNCVDNSDCGENEYCFAKTWGDYKDACVEDNPDNAQDGFFSYSYIYTCDALSDYWQADCSSYNSDIQGPCCVYSPNVTIIDNWGNQTVENLGDCNNPNGEACLITVVPR